MEDPVAFAPVELALGGDELDVPELPDEHALTDATTARPAATTTKILRLRTMSHSPSVSVRRLWRITK
jgi:hypothetical protein